MIAFSLAVLFALPAQAQLLTPESRAALGEKALMVLRAAMQDEDPNVRTLAAQEWGLMGNPAAIPALKTLLKDPNPNVRIAAVWSLYQLGNRSGLPVLMKIVQGPAKAKKKKKSKSPANPLLELKMIAQDKARVEAVKIYSQIDSSSTVKALQGLRKDPSGAVRDAATAALVRLGNEEMMGGFVGALDSEDEGERLSAVRNLASIGTPAVIEPLHRMLVDASIPVRVAALQGLGATGSAEALPDLQEGLRDDSELEHAAAIEAMGHIQSQDTIPLLKDALARSSNAYIRMLATEALARQGQEVDLGLVERSFDHSDVDARDQAVKVLEATGGGELALKIFETALNDSQPRVRVHAAAALVKMLQHAKKQ